MEKSYRSNVTHKIGVFREEEEGEEGELERRGALRGATLLSSWGEQNTPEKSVTSGGQQMKK